MGSSGSKSVQAPAAQDAAAQAAAKEMKRLRRRARRRVLRNRKNKQRMADLVDRLTWACFCGNVGLLKEKPNYCSYCGKKLR